jgi:hypothetical protein
LVEHVPGVPPFVDRHEQRAAIGASQCTGEASAVKLDRLKQLATVPNTHAPFVGDVAVPDGVLGVDADAVGDPIPQVSPESPVPSQRVTLSNLVAEIWENDPPALLPKQWRDADRSALRR